MANVSISQIRGSFSNFLQANPSFLAAFFAQFPSADAWTYGTGKPTTTPAGATFYFDIHTGDIWQFLNTGSGLVWMYQCNYFNDPTYFSKCKTVLFSDINQGSSPKTTMDVPLVTLAPDEFINDIVSICIAEFNNPGNTDDTRVSMYDLTGNATVSTLAQLNVQVHNSDNITSMESYFQGQLFSNGQRSIVARFTSTDLTLLNQGELTICWNSVMLYR